MFDEKTYKGHGNVLFFILYIYAKIFLMKKNDIIKLDICDMTVEGMGVGKENGQAVFVKGALIGEKVEAQIIKMAKNYAVAKVNAILSASPHRVEPHCPKKRCGGCTLECLSYEAQLEYKQRYVKSCFERIAKVDVEVEKCAASPNVLNYRNKCAFPVGKELKSGFFAQHSHEIIEVESCAIQDEDINEAYAIIKELLKKHNVQGYDEISGKGCLRHIVIRKVKSGLNVVLVINGKGISKGIIKDIADKNEKIQNISINFNDKNTNVILGRETKTVFERGELKEEFSGLEFLVSANSFLQVNHEQAQNLYDCAMEFADISKEDTVADLYCGIGTMTLIAAKKAKKVYGIEIVPQAIENANRNAALNGITNAEFFLGDAKEAEQKIFKNGVDIVIVDPPRKGLDAEVVYTIMRNNPKKIVYVSCDAATLARDCALFNEGGYEIKKVKPFDMFPHTTHVETVVLMEKE